MSKTEKEINFEPGEFRQALGMFATGVTVVTATSPGGLQAGVTANSFTSVSLKPPLILWCLASSSESLPVYRSAPYFAVNILASDQLELSGHFARGQDDKFRSVAFREGRGRAPLLDGCASRLQCRSAGHYQMGDHHVFVGEVVELETTGKETLLYHQGNYAVSLPHPDTDTRESTHARQAEPEDNLYSLMLHAIHAYQEKFELRQHQIIESNYEARVLLLLRNGVTGPDIADLSRKIQVPRSEIEEILRNLAGKGLISYGDRPVLTEPGRLKAARLWELYRQHEADAMALFGPKNAELFKKSLRQLILWGHKNPPG